MEPMRPHAIADREAPMNLDWAAKPIRAGFGRCRIGHGHHNVDATAASDAAANAKAAKTQRVRTSRQRAGFGDTLIATELSLLSDGIWPEAGSSASRDLLPHTLQSGRVWLACRAKNAGSC
jgi:hypothetical protein